MTFPKAKRVKGVLCLPPKGGGSNTRSSTASEFSASFAAVFLHLPRQGENSSAGVRNFESRMLLMLNAAVAMLNAAPADHRVGAGREHFPININIPVDFKTQSTSPLTTLFFRKNLWQDF